MLIYDFIQWKIIDLIEFIKYGKVTHMYGIKLYCGLPGHGKTMALTEYLTRMRHKYGDRVYIATNYGFKGEDFPLEGWEQMLTEYDKPIIFGYDEIQNEFNSRDYKNFPYELVGMLTQTRKRKGKQIVATAQRYTRVDKVFRELCDTIAECTTFAGRLTTVKYYDHDDYQQLINVIGVNKKLKVPHVTYRFVQSDGLRKSYDSYRMLESAKTKEYMTQEEIFQKYAINRN